MKNKKYCTKDNSYFAGTEIKNPKNKKCECNNISCINCVYYK